MARMAMPQPVLIALCKKIREVLGENKQEKGEASGAG
jgi:hypothetical protein